MFLTILHKRYFQFKTISIHIPVGDVLVLPGPECILESISILIPVGDVFGEFIVEFRKKMISILIPRMGCFYLPDYRTKRFLLYFNTHPRRGCFFWNTHFFFLFSSISIHIPVGDVSDNVYKICCLRS